MVFSPTKCPGGHEYTKKPNDFSSNVSVIPIRQKKFFPGVPCPNFGVMMRSDPPISKDPRRVKFDDLCGHQTSLGVSNEFKLGQMLDTDDTKTLAKFCQNPTS